MDVLAVLLQAETRCGPALAEAVLEVRSAVIELLAADREYDAANRDWEHFTSLDPDDFSAEDWKRVADRFEEAVMRRIAALAKFGGAA